MINKDMLELLFRPASIQRWNDHIRPHTGFCELEMLYFLEEEFSSKVQVGGQVLVCSSEAISQQYADDIYNPLDGELVKICDQLAAYIEAAMPIDYGMKAPDLLRGKQQVYQKSADTKLCGIDFKVCFDYYMED